MLSHESNVTSTQVDDLSLSFPSNITKRVMRHDCESHGASRHVDPKLEKLILLKRMYFLSDSGGRKKSWFVGDKYAF